MIEKILELSYEELDAKGWVEIRDRSGVYVSGDLPEMPAYPAKNLFEAGSPPIP